MIEMESAAINCATASMDGKNRTAILLQLERLCVRSAGRPIIREVTQNIPEHGVFGILGPSGAGKSTLLKSLNRLIDLTPSLRVTGDVRFKGRSIFARGVDVDALRARVGMIFQQPVVFPTSIFNNVVFGLRRLRSLPANELRAAAERALSGAALWNEVKDRLNEPGNRLSVGQQQRLCLARTLALEPEVILMDEPTSALDPKSSEAIEELILQLKGRRTIIIVTHNHAQADRVCDEIMQMTPFGSI